MSKPLRLLVAGGCHVVGFPHAVQQSFGYMATAPYDVEYSTLAGLNLRRYEVLIQVLHERPPDLLILQFGNYECPIQIKKHFRQTFRVTTKGRTSDLRHSCSNGGRTSETRESEYFQPTLRWKSKMIVKRLYAIIAAGVGKPIYEPEVIEGLLRNLLSRIKPFSIPNVIVLAPLPCADPVSRKYRLLAAGLFAMVCKNADVLFVDCGVALGYAKPSFRGSLKNFTDDIHLSRQGHQRLADAISPILSQVIRSGKVNESHRPEHLNIRQSQID